MQISPVNLVYKPSYTDNRNSYKRSNLGKTLMVTSTTATLLSSAARPIPKDQKPALKTCGALLTLALMIGTFIDAVVNKISAGIVDHRAQSVRMEASCDNNSSKLAAHQG